MGTQMFVFAILFSFLAFSPTYYLLHSCSTPLLLKHLQAGALMAVPYILQCFFFPTPCHRTRTSMIESHSIFPTLSHITLLNTWHAAVYMNYSVPEVCLVLSLLCNFFLYFFYAKNAFPSHFLSELPILQD